MTLKKGVPFLADYVTTPVFPKNSRSTESNKLIGETGRFTCRNGYERDHQESWEDQIRALRNAAETCGGGLEARESSAGPMPVVARIAKPGQRGRYEAL